MTEKVIFEVKLGDPILAYLSRVEIKSSEDGYHTLHVYGLSADESKKTLQESLTNPPIEHHLLVCAFEPHIPESKMPLEITYVPKKHKHFELSINDKKWGF